MLISIEGIEMNNFQKLGTAELQNIVGGRGHSHNYYSGRNFGRTLRNVSQMLNSSMRPISIWNF